MITEGGSAELSPPFLGSIVKGHGLVAVAVVSR